MKVPCTGASIDSTALPHPGKAHRKLDEDAIAECIARAAELPYAKLDPLRLDSDLITKTFSRPFVSRHIVIPIGRDGDRLQLAVSDPFDSALRETLEQLVEGPVCYAVSAKRDILAIIDRVYGP